MSSPSKRPPTGSPRGRDLPREVRIIGGRWKRTRLPVGDVAGLRPTPDRVRETVFNWLGQDLTGWRCLDAFAGTGALGLEAASRGAASVVLLEQDRAQVRRLQDTLVRLAAATVRVECADAIGWMGRCPPGAFDLIFIDPPFDSPLAATALAASARVLGSDGVVYLEAPHALAPEQAATVGFDIWRQGRAGAVHHHLLRRAVAG